MVKNTARSPYPLKEPRYQLHMKLGAPERLRTISASQGFQLQTVHPLASRQYQLHSAGYFVTQMARFVKKSDKVELII